MDVSPKKAAPAAFAHRMRLPSARKTKAGPAIEQRLADRGQRREVEIGVGLAVHPGARPGSFVGFAAGSDP